MDFARIENAFSPSDDRKSAIGRNGVIAAAFPEAVAAGAAVLRAGGNAVDAACAANFVLGVCEPQGSGWVVRAWVCSILAAERWPLTALHLCRH